MKPDSESAEARRRAFVERQLPRLQAALMERIDGLRRRIATVLAESDREGIDRREPALAKWLARARAEVEELLRRREGMAAEWRAAAEPAPAPSLTELHGDGDDGLYTGED